MSKSVIIVDYGIGNLHSVYRAFEQCGCLPTISSDPEVVRRADRLVLPGVGAFESGIHNLGAGGLVEPVKEFARTGKPFLGICLGMQLLFDYSEEFGRHAGLGLIPGKVTPIPNKGADGTAHKIPHIGWNALRLPKTRTDWTNSILSGLRTGDATYFVHSYTAFPEHDADRLADCDYDGCQISATVARDNVMGCQFHPEKSGAIGLKIISTFLSL
ncbi:MAG TPA: imidazole glycerol phosphate synthase subunit HisH [Burkholderiales bacterium]|nr:imidazole glycerol phosphate synthase subunit HisH [Burkholderiales bacterium]